MKVFKSLCILYLKSFFNLGSGSKGGKKNKAKETAQRIGIAAAVIILVASLGASFVAVNYVMYGQLAAGGMQSLLILNTAIIVTVFALLFGFMTALTTYYVNDMELQLVSMPIRPRTLLAAKFTAVYAYEALLSLFFVIALMVVFGIQENPGPLFYAWGLAAALLLPLPPLVFSYFIQIPLFRSARFLKNKRALMVLSAIFGIAAALGFNVYFQGIAGRLDNPEAMAAMMEGPFAIISYIGKYYPPAWCMWKAMASPASLGAAGAILAMAALCVALPAILVVALSSAYAKSLIGFDEQHVKKLSKEKAASFIARDIRAGSSFWTLLTREIKSMNREPVYLLNGPFVIILMPIMAVIILYARGAGSFLSDPRLAALMSSRGGLTGIIIAAFAGVFLASGTSVANTALTRDAKSLPIIKSLPIRSSSYMLAKWLHAYLFSIIGTIIGVGIVAAFLQLPLSAIAAASFVSLSFSALLDLLALWLDTANPRLVWDTPVAAMKQNPNAVIGIFGIMAIVGASAFSLLFFNLSLAWLLGGFGLIPLALFALLLRPYLGYAERKIRRLEV